MGWSGKVVAVFPSSKEYSPCFFVAFCLISVILNLVSDLSSKLQANTLLGKKGNGKVSKNVLFSQNQGFDLQGISFFKILLNQRYYLPNQNGFQLWWKGIAYLWKKNLKHLLIENSFHSRLDGNTLEGGQKWFARCKPILLKDSILQRFYMRCKSFSF